LTGPDCASTVGALKALLAFNAAAVAPTAPAVLINERRVIFDDIPASLCETSSFIERRAALGRTTVGRPARISAVRRLRARGEHTPRGRTCRGESVNVR
jgi:hypothetical protein